MLPDGCFYLDAEGARGLDGARLHGYAVFEDAVVFGSEGLAAYRAATPDAMPREGRFAAAIRQGDRLVVRTDVTGQESLYLYRRDDDWAVSNSFLLLASQVAQRSRLALHAPAAVAFHLKAGTHVGEQLLSHRTLIEGIEMIPATSDLVVDLRSGSVEILDRAFLDVFRMEGSYEETLLAAMERMAGLLAALAEAGTGGLWVMLSGGYDSRMVLGLTLAGGRPPALDVTSYPHKTADFPIARAICEGLGLPLNRSAGGGAGPLSAGEALRVWALSCAGTYLPVYPVTRLTPRPGSEIRLTGDQPTGWTFFEGQATFNGGWAKVAGDIEAALRPRGHAGEARDDFLSVFDRIGIDREHPRAMAAHYSAIRSRHHYGRHWFKELGGQRLVTPLMTSAMVALEMHAGERGWGVTRVFADIFSALGGWVLDFPFDSPGKAFAPEMLDASPFRGGVRIEPRPMRVLGLDSVRSTDASRLAAPDLLVPDLRLSFRPDDIGTLLGGLLRQVDRTRFAPYVTAADLAAARAELEMPSPSLSHGLRRTTHAVTLDLVAGLVERSGR